MLFDKLTMFSDQQAVTAAANSDVIHFGEQLGYANGADGPELVIQVTEDFATLTSLQVTLKTSDSNDGTDLSTPDTLVTSAAIAAADLVAGYRFPIEKLPMTGIKKYLQLTYTVAGSDATTGAVTAGLVFNSQSN